MHSVQPGVPADWLWCHPLHEHHDKLPEVVEQPPQSGELVLEQAFSIRCRGLCVACCLKMLLLIIDCFCTVRTPRRHVPAASLLSVKQVGSYGVVGCLPGSAFVAGHLCQPGPGEDERAVEKLWHCSWCCPAAHQRVLDVQATGRRACTAQTGALPISWGTVDRADSGSRQSLKCVAQALPLCKQLQQLGHRMSHAAV